MIVARPTPTAVTHAASIVGVPPGARENAAGTVATAVSLLANVTTRQGSGFPVASNTWAASGIDVVATSAVADSGVTTTEATGVSVSLTNTVTLAAIPSTMTVIRADPSEMPVTRPVDDTTAATGLSVDHVTGWPITSRPSAS